MHAYVQERLPRLIELCRVHKVKRLDLFGSGTGDRFDLAHSDLDFVIEFLPEASRGLAGYFDFKYAVEDLYSREINLVEAGAVKNPYFRQELDETKELLYAA